MTPQIRSRIYELLGDAVALPIPLGKKGCMLTGWPSITYAQSKTPEHQQKLLSHGNTGILLGPASGNLITVDCDSDAALEAFLDRNPTLRKTFITKGARGGNVWGRMAGKYPPKMIRLGEDGKCGEFRSAGSQTVIAGKHPDGMDYRWIVEAPPLTMPYQDIVWPPGWMPGDTQHAAIAAGTRGGGGSTESLSPAILHPCASAMLQPCNPVILHPCASAMLQSCASAPLHNTPPQVVAILAVQSFEQQHPALSRLVEPLIGSHLPLEEGARNTVLTHEIAPRLFGALGTSAAFMVLDYLIASGSLGGYPPDEAREKFGHVMEAMAQEYIEQLTPDEQACFGSLDQQGQEAFRICRALADLSDPPPPDFFLSSGDFAERLGIRSAQQAYRILRKFVRCRILIQLHRGAPRQQGAAGKAAEFAWNFPLITRE